MAGPGVARGGANKSCRGFNYGISCDWGATIDGSSMLIIEYVLPVPETPYVNTDDERPEKALFTRGATSLRKTSSCVDAAV